MMNSIQQPSRWQRDEEERRRAREALNAKRHQLEVLIFQLGGWLEVGNKLRMTGENLKRLVRLGATSDVNSIAARMRSLL